jgi:hypothetical protein
MFSWKIFSVIYRSDVTATFDVTFTRSSYPLIFSTWINPALSLHRASNDFISGHIYFQPSFSLFYICTIKKHANLYYQTFK